MPTHEKLDYLEFSSRDLDASKAFFTKVFAWTFTDYGPGYTAFDNQGLEGGLFLADQSSSTRNGAALPIFYSENLEATYDKITAAGGQIIQEVFDFPGGRRFHFTEPGGNELAVWTDKKPV